MRGKRHPKLLLRILLIALFLSASAGFPVKSFAASDFNNSNKEVAFVYTEDADSNTKNVATVLNGENIEIESASLEYDIDGTAKSTKAVKVYRNSALFSIEMEEGKKAELKLVKYKMNSSEQVYTATLKNDGIALALRNSDGSKAAVDSTGISSQIDSNVVSIEDNAVDTTDDIASSLNRQESAGDVSLYSLNATTHNLVISLDPGHGGWDPGAGAFGLREKDLTLKIARYCKQALEQYPGVTVYMTRDGDYSPSGTQDTGADLRARVNNSIANGADALVSK